MLALIAGTIPAIKARIGVIIITNIKASKLRSFGSLFPKKAALKIGSTAIKRVRKSRKIKRDENKDQEEMNIIKDSFK